MRTLIADLRTAASESLPQVSEPPRQDQSHIMPISNSIGSATKPQRPSDISGLPLGGDKRHKNISLPYDNDGKLERFLRPTSGLAKEPADDHIIRPTHLSIFRPLNPAESYTPHENRPLPNWMGPHTLNHTSNYTTSPPSSHDTLISSQLPSQRQSLEYLNKPGSQSIHSAYSYESLQRPTPLPPNFSTANPKVATFIARHQSLPIRPLKKKRSLVSFLRTSKTFPGPVMEDTLTSAPPSPGKSPSLDFQKSPPTAGPSPQREQPNLFQNGEFLKRYRSRLPPGLEVPLEFCPICEEPTNTPFPASQKEPDATQPEAVSTVTASNSLTYHISCLTCGSCRQPFLPTSNISDWTFVGFSSPYHRSCMIQAEKPMLERLKRKLSMQVGIAQKQLPQQGEQSVGILNDASLAVPNISSSASPVDNKSQWRRSESQARRFSRSKDVLRPQPSLSSLFSRRQLPLRRSATSLSSVIRQSTLDEPSSPSSVPLP